MFHHRTQRSTAGACASIPFIVVVVVVVSRQCGGRNSTAYVRRGRSGMEKRSTHASCPGGVLCRCVWTILVPGTASVASESPAGDATLMQPLGVRRAHVHATNSVLRSLLAWRGLIACGAAGTGDRSIHHDKRLAGGSLAGTCGAVGCVCKEDTYMVFGIRCTAALSWLCGVHTGTYRYGAALLWFRAVMGKEQSFGQRAVWVLVVA